MHPGYLLGLELDHPRYDASAAVAVGYCQREGTPSVDGKHPRTVAVSLADLVAVDAVDDNDPLVEHPARCLEILSLTGGGKGDGSGTRVGAHHCCSTGKSKHNGRQGVDRDRGGSTGC